MIHESFWVLQPLVACFLVVACIWETFITVSTKDFNVSLYIMVCLDFYENKGVLGDWYPVRMAFCWEWHLSTSIKWKATFVHKGFWEDAWQFMVFVLCSSLLFAVVLKKGRFQRSSALSPIIMEVENYPKRKETTIGGTHFSLPWLWEEGLGDILFTRDWSTPFCDASVLSGEEKKKIPKPRINPGIFIGR